MFDLIHKAFPPAARCHRKHCDHWAKFVPVIRIPAKDCPILEHDPIVVLIEIPLCEHHSTSMNAGEFVTKRFRSHVKGLCKAQGKAEPDFKRAFVQRKPIGQDV